MRPGLLGLVAALVAAGAVGLSEAKTAALGESFRLEVGESVLIEGEALQIGFEDVPADSRCPKGERCIWEGDAQVRIWVRQASGAKKKYDLHTSAGEQRAVSDLDYGIELLQLTPYPVSGRKIEPEDYEATLEVTRGSSPPSDTR